MELEEFKSLIIQAEQEKIDQGLSEFIEKNNSEVDENLKNRLKEAKEIYNKIVSENSSKPDFLKEVIIGNAQKQYKKDVLFHIEAAEKAKS